MSDRIGPMRRFGDWYDRRILPRIVDRSCGVGELAARRRQVAAGLSGAVVEIGFGTGHNLPFLPDTVTRLLAVDPSELGRELAGKRLAEAPIPVDFIGLDGHAIALADASVDAALCTFTLCTVDDPEAVLGEVRRVLRPGGALHFLEHGRSPDPKVARWQHRLTPIQKRIGGGCHLDRPIDTLLVAAGFDIVDLSNDYLRGPKTAGYVYQGVAAPR